MIWVFECHRSEAVGSGYNVCITFILRLQIQAGTCSAIKRTVQLTCNITVNKNVNVLRVS